MIIDPARSFRRFQWKFIKLTRAFLASNSRYNLMNRHFISAQNACQSLNRYMNIRT